MTYQDAWNHLVNEEKRGWQEAILKELTDMEVKRKIWVKDKIKDIPDDRKLIGSKWVFKWKNNGIFCARFCALWYSHIP